MGTKGNTRRFRFWSLGEGAQCSRDFPWLSFWVSVSVGIIRPEFFLFKREHFKQIGITSTHSALESIKRKELSKNQKKPKMFRYSLILSSLLWMKPTWIDSLYLKTGGHDIGSLEKAISQPDVSLVELLNEDELINQIKRGNDALINMYSFQVSPDFFLVLSV